MKQDNSYTVDKSNAFKRFGGGRNETVPMCDRQVIAWDMEGLSLSGQDKPQHPVLFGCSAEVDTPLVSERLTMDDMLGRILKIGQKYPHAIHVGFAFNYDTNMIVHGLNEELLKRLWADKTVRFGRHAFPGLQFTLTWYPGKKLVVSARKVDGSRKGRPRRATPGRVTVTIEDYSSFFGGKTFLSTAEQLLKDELSDYDRETIAHGKAARGHQTWEDMADIRHYWEREIVLIRRTFEKFRDVMYQAGYYVRKWYGPGALANYINTVHNLKPHLAGAQESSQDGFLPTPVHIAAKHAYAGGRFELFQGGHINQPVYAVDINSAYPFALTMIPSLAEGNGEWVYVDSPDEIEHFGFYRVSYNDYDSPDAIMRPQPFFHRDPKGLITFPPTVHNWYASPEAKIAMDHPKAIVHEGWYWREYTSERPLAFLHDTYDTRKRLKDSGQELLSLPFKLGPNSMYGKYAQTVGWNKDTGEPPKWHALAIAAWTTSLCRRMLYNVIVQCPHEIVAVETDSVFLTRDPRTLTLSIGDKLGQWDFEEYEDLIYLQSGMYYAKQDGEWLPPKSRGLNKTDVPLDQTVDYIKNLEAGQRWEPLTIQTKPRFIGLGTALMSEKPTHMVHCSWVPQTREVSLGDSGKRKHSSAFCPQCRDGISPWEAPHRMHISSKANYVDLSTPRPLPWEQSYSDEVQEIRDNVQAEKGD